MPALDSSGGGGFVNESLGGAAPIGSIFLFFEGRWVLIVSEGSTGSVFPVVAGIRIPLGG